MSGSLTCLTGMIGMGPLLLAAYQTLELGPGFLILGVVALAATLFWGWMLVDCINNKALSDIDRIVWLVVIFLTQIVGALLYFFIVRRPQKSRPVT